MYSLLLLAASSFALCLLLTPVCRDAFEKAGILDRPDQDRKRHGRSIPRIGGIPIALAVGLSYALLILSPLAGGAVVTQGLPFVWQLLPAAGVVFVTGLVDDLAGLRPVEKLAGQMTGAGLAYWAGVRISGVAGVSTPSWWGLIATLLWLVACTNAFNLIDGVDGVACGIGLVSTLTMLIAGLLHRNELLVLATAPLAGALLGFLRFNFNPASIYMGDCGSLSVGFLLGCYGVLWSQKSVTLPGMTAPLMVLAVPILDTALAVARRFLERRPIFAADRCHIPHRLLDRGFTPRRVALVLYGVCGLGAVLSLSQSVAHAHYSGLIVILFCALAWIGVRRLELREFTVVRRVLLGGGIREVLSGEMGLARMQEKIRAARTPRQCWLAVSEAAGGLGFTYVEMCLAGEFFERRPKFIPVDSWWTVRIRVSSEDWVSCRREPGVLAITGTAPFADTLLRTLREKLPQLEPSLVEEPAPFPHRRERPPAQGSPNVMIAEPAATVTYCLPSNE